MTHSDEPARATLRVTIDEISVNAADERIATLVTDDGQSFVLPLALLPPGARHGDTLHISIEPDEHEAKRRRARISDLQRRLFGTRE